MLHAGNTLPTRPTDKGHANYIPDLRRVSKINRSTTVFERPHISPAVWSAHYASNITRNSEQILKHAHIAPTYCNMRHNMRAE